MKKNIDKYDYDVALSFAGEDRKFVNKVAKAMTGVGLRVFYDDYEKSELWGKDLYEHLHEIYSRRAYFCCVFISKHYKNKLWTNHERKSAQERAFTENKEYILPIRIDETKIIGIRSTVGFIKSDTSSPENIAALLKSKIGPRFRKNYFPPDIDRVFKALKIRTKKEKDAIGRTAYYIFELYKRMNKNGTRNSRNYAIAWMPGGLP